MLRTPLYAALGRTGEAHWPWDQPRTWACAILYELGRVNFLSDPSTRPHMTLADEGHLAGRLTATRSN